MRKARKQYTPTEKVAILKRHLVDEVAVSDLCDEYHLHPTVFYNWQKLFFENGVVFPPGLARFCREPKTAALRIGTNAINPRGSGGLVPQ